MNFALATKQFSSATDTLTVTNGTHSVSILLIGHYAAGNFNLESEGGGTDTLVVDPPVGASDPSMVGLVGPHNT